MSAMDYVVPAGRTIRLPKKWPVGATVTVLLVGVPKDGDRAEDEEE